MDGILGLVVIVTWVWMLVDAGNNGFGREKFEDGSTSPGIFMLAIAGLMLWIVVVPLYFFYYRPKLQRAIASRKKSARIAEAKKEKDSKGYLEELDRLGSLRERGILTDIEFEAKKAEVMNRCGR